MCICCRPADWQTIQLLFRSNIETQSAQSAPVLASAARPPGGVAHLSGCLRWQHSPTPDKQEPEISSTTGSFRVFLGMEASALPQHDCSCLPLRLPQAHWLPAQDIVHHSFVSALPFGDFSEQELFSAFSPLPLSSCARRRTMCTSSSTTYCRITSFRCGWRSLTSRAWTPFWPRFQTGRLRTCRCDEKWRV